MARWAEGMTAAERKKMNMAAVRAGAKPIRSMARQLAPIHRSIGRRGLPSTRGKASYLRKSIITKVRGWSLSGNAVAVVGPRKKTVMVGGIKKNPSKYAHLVELGHRILYPPYRSKRGTWTWAQVPPRPFIRPAIERNKQRSIDLMKATWRKHVTAWFLRNIKGKSA